MDSNNDVHGGSIIEHLVSSNKQPVLRRGRQKVPSQGAMRHRGLEGDDHTGPAQVRALARTWITKHPGWHALRRNRVLPLRLHRDQRSGRSQFANVTLHEKISRCKN